jgi:hypothetical protein
MNFAAALQHSFSSAVNCNPVSPNCISTPILVAERVFKCAAVAFEVASYVCTCKADFPLK